MPHMNTQLLTEYWRARRPPSGSPPRSSIDPTQFVDLLPQVFILGRACAGLYRFRLAGGQLADVHGRPLLGDDFLTLWAPLDRASVLSAMEGARRRSQPLVMSAAGRTASGGDCELEILLAPVAGADGGLDRFLGLYQGLSPLAVPLGQPIDELHVRRILVVGDGRAGQPPVEAPRLRLAAIGGRRIG